MESLLIRLRQQRRLPRSQPSGSLVRRLSLSLGMSIVHLMPNQNMVQSVIQPTHQSVIQATNTANLPTTLQVLVFALTTVLDTNNTNKDYLFSFSLSFSLFFPSFLPFFLPSSFADPKQLSNNVILLNKGSVIQSTESDQNIQVRWRSVCVCVCGQ